MFFSISRAWPSSSSIMTILTGAPTCVLFIRILRFACPLPRQRHRKCAALAKLRGETHGPAEPANQRPDMGEADAFAGPVLDAGAAEQFEDAFMVRWVDAAPVVLDVVNDAVPASRGLNSMCSGPRAADTSGHCR